MFGVGVGIRVGGRTAASSGGGYDPDAQAFFDRVTTAGGTLTTTEKNATNQLVLDMKSAGIWSAMKAVYPMVGASASACAQNLKSSSFTGTFTSGWTFASTGVTPNGTSAYMDSAFIPSSNLTTTSGHFSFYSRTSTPDLPEYDFGSQDGSSNPNTIIIKYSNGSFYAAYGQYNATYSNSNSQGFYVVNRNSVTDTTGFKNNSKVITQSQTASLSTTALYLSAFNNNGTAIQFSTKECAFSSIGDGLTDTQASNLYTAVQNFNQTLNRQVGAQIVSDADAQAFINRVYTAGGTLTNTEANAVNQLVIDMKAAGIWTSMKAVYPMVGSSAAACAQNLKSGSFTGTFSSGWTFNSNGVTGNGSSAYMNTGLNLLSNYGTSFNNHFSIYYRTDNTNTSKYGALGSVYSDGMSAHIDYVNNNTYNDNMGRNQLSNSSYGTSNAFHLSSLTSTTSQKLFRNNVLKINGSAINTSVYPNINFYFGGLNNNGTADYFDNRQIAFGSIGDGLNDTQAADFYTCVQTFNTSLSRQVV